METLEHDGSWTDSCLSYTNEVAQASGVVAGATAFTKDINEWAGKTIETENPLMLGMAPEVGAHAGKDAVDAYQSAFTNAEHNWAEGCHFLGNFIDAPTPPAWSPDLAANVPNAFSGMPSAWGGATSQPVAAPDAFAHTPSAWGGMSSHSSHAPDAFSHVASAFDGTGSHSSHTPDAFAHAGSNWGGSASHSGPTPASFSHMASASGTGSGSTGGQGHSASTSAHDHGASHHSGVHAGMGAA